MSARPRLGPRRVPPRPRRRSPPPGGRRAARRAADGRRAVHLHARRRAAVRDAPDADRGAAVDGARRGGHDPRRHPPAPRARRRCLTSEPAAGRPPRRTRPGCPTATTVQTYVSSRKVGTRRPVRPRSAAVTSDRGPPRARRTVYDPLTRPPDGVAARPVRPPGRLLPERPRDRRLPGDRVRRPSPAARRSSSSATTRGPSRSPRTGPDYRGPDRGRPRRRRDPPADRVDRRPGRRATRSSSSYVPDAPLPPSAFAFTFPPGTTLIY